MAILMLFCTVIFVLVVSWHWEYLTGTCHLSYRPNPRHYESKDLWEAALKDYEQQRKHYNIQTNRRNLLRGVCITIGSLLFIGWLALWWNWAMAL